MWIFKLIPVGGARVGARSFRLTLGCEYEKVVTVMNERCPEPMARFSDPRFSASADLLGPGVYVLESRGRIVHIAFTRCLLDRIAKHRELAHAGAPSWFPIRPIRFDRFYTLRCSADIAETIVAELTALHLPEPCDASPT